MRLAWLVAVSLVGCGRIAFDPPADVGRSTERPGECRIELDFRVDNEQKVELIERLETGV